MIGYKILSGITILSALVGCTLIPSTNGTWIIFPENRAEEMHVGTWLSADEGGYWTPTEENILLLEQKLDSFLSQNSESFHRQPPVW
jgi:hypothetical protein